MGRCYVTGLSDNQPHLRHRYIIVTFCRGPLHLQHDDPASNKPSWNERLQCIAWSSACEVHAIAQWCTYVPTATSDDRCISYQCNFRRACKWERFSCAV